MGLQNSPAVHQHCVFSALQNLLSKICHVYLDDVIIWSDGLAEHKQNVRLVLEALQNTNLYCSVKKSNLFCTEVDFLGHHISCQGIKPDVKKVNRIMNWPVPKLATDVHMFLGLMLYIADFLPGLADHMRILTPLTYKFVDTTFPPWLPDHQHTFQCIKDLVTSADCSVNIDHNNISDNKIFVTCDASDWCTGTMLSYGLT